MRRLSRAFTLFVASAGVNGPFGDPAAAQDDAALLRDGLFARDRNISVAERPKPEYQPLPLRIGAWSISPVLTSGLRVVDNLYASPAKPAADAAAVISPALSVTSDWPRHALTLYADADLVRYAAYPSEDRTDHEAGGRLRLDIHHDLGLAAGFSEARITEPRTDEASPPDAARPIHYEETDGWVEAAAVLGRLRLTARGAVERDAYADDQTFTGQPLYERDRDQTDLAAAVKAEFAYRPDAAFTLSLRADHRDYSHALPGEASRDNAGYEAAAGINLDLTHLVRGALEVGYLRRDYDSVFYKRVAGVAVNGRLEYFPTGLTTLTLSGARAVRDSGLYQGGGYLDQTAKLRIDHELLRNLVLSAWLAYDERDYQTLPRTDRIQSGAVSAAYLMNRAFSVEFSYETIRQASTGAPPGPRYAVGRSALALVYRP